MKKLAAALALALAASVQASAQDSPLWLRNTAISPDGSRIAFTYKGDIYTVPVAGGRASRLTADPAVDSNPMWSPDGTKIAFASMRDGGQNIYVMGANGGTPRRITLSLFYISAPPRPYQNSYARFRFQKKKQRYVLYATDVTSASTNTI